VDSRLNVYGVRGLKVADLSIGPGNVSANTYLTALVIGEKACSIGNATSHTVSDNTLDAQLLCDNHGTPWTFCSSYYGVHI
ncbi:hypothetical protein DFH94DRAFT_640732, partial [Russula ochroleuca]